MPNIRPIAELRNTSKISKICHEKDEPVFITKNGYGDLVIMSMETYEKKIAIAELYEKLNVAEKEAAEGKELYDADKVFDSLRQKYERYDSK